MRHRVEFEYEGSNYAFVHTSGDDHIAKWQANARGFYEAPLLEELRCRLTDRDGIIVDVGAHVGNHTVYFAGVMGRPVIAFEPNPAVVPCLVRNVDLNKVNERVTVVGVAATGHPQWVRPLPLGDGANTGMQRFERHQGPELGSGRPGVPVDSVLPPDSEPRVALVKLDVEGFEGEALLGVLGTLVRHRPLLAIEAQDAAALAVQKELLLPHRYQRSQQWWGATPVHIWTPHP